MRKRPSAILILSTILFGACENIAPIPTAIVTMKPISTSTSVLAVPTLIIPSPTKSPLTTTPAAAESIRLYHNEISTRTIRDEFSFSVIVTDKKADFVPQSIQIIEKGTNLIIGQYKLFNETEMKSLCSNLMQNPSLVFYETALIDYSELPQGFLARAYEDDYIFRITIEYLSGGQEVVEISAPQRPCYSAVQ